VHASYEMFILAFCESSNRTWDRLWCACVHDGLRIVMMVVIWYELGTETSPRAVQSD